MSILFIHLIGVIILPFYPFLIAASRAQRYTPLCVCPISAMRKLFKPLVGDRPPIPRQGPLSLPANTPQMERLRALAGAENERLDRLEREVCSQHLAGRATAPLGAMKKTAAGDPFPGFRFQYQISVLRECIYSCPACHDCFEWDWDSRPA